MIVNPHNQIAPINIKNIVIFGGGGAMGKKLAELFSGQGYFVKISDIAHNEHIDGRIRKKYNRKLLQWADFVVFSLPAQVMQKSLCCALFGLRCLKGLRNKIFMDVCSVKTGLELIVTEFRGANFVSTHPMFGPSITSFKGQNVVVCPVQYKSHVMTERNRLAIEFVSQFWKKFGANVLVMDSMTHDRITSHIQAGLVISVATLVNSLRTSGVSFEDVLKIATPNMKLFLLLISRVLRKEAAGLYANIIIENNFNLETVKAFADTLTDVNQLIAHKDHNAAANFFMENSNFSALVNQQFFSSSNKVIDMFL